MNLRIVLILILSQCGAAFGATGQIDQEYVPFPQNEESQIIAESQASSPTIEWSQTFTVGITGRLTGFDLWIERVPGLTQPLLFDVRTTGGGIPTEADAGSNILGNGSVAADSVPFETGLGLLTLPDPIHIDTNNLAIDVSAGDLLAIRLSTSANPNIVNGYEWRGNEPGDYLNGAAYVRAFGRVGNSGGWHTQDGVDQLFRTYVLPIPEPSTFALTILALVALPTRRRKSVPDNRV
jgi:hypothetical protein